MAGKSLRWQNFPVPEAHLIGLAFGAVLERVRPLHRRPSGPTARLSGLALAAAGAGLAPWAIRSAGNTGLSRPERLVIAGRYSRSRHPMCVA